MVLFPLPPNSTVSTSERDPLNSQMFIVFPHLYFFTILHDDCSFVRQGFSRYFLMFEPCPPYPYFVTVFHTVKTIKSFPHDEMSQKYESRACRCVTNILKRMVKRRELYNLFYIGDNSGYPTLSSPSS